MSLISKHSVSKYPKLVVRCPLGHDVPITSIIYNPIDDDEIVLKTDLCPICGDLESKAWHQGYDTAVEDTKMRRIKL